MTNYFNLRLITVLAMLTLVQASIFCMQTSVSTQAEAPAATGRPTTQPIAMDTDEPVQIIGTSTRQTPQASYCCCICHSIIDGYKNFLIHQNSHKKCTLCHYTWNKMHQNQADHQQEQSILAIPTASEPATPATALAATELVTLSYIQAHTASTPELVPSPPAPQEAGSSPDKPTALEENHSAATEPAMRPAVERLYKCTRKGCQFATDKKSNLILHWSIHTGKKPYNCTYPGCDYVSPQKAHIERHIKTHKGEKLFACHYPDCEYTSTIKTHLNKHILEHHKLAPQPYSSTADIVRTSALIIQRSDPFVKIEI